MSTTASKTKHPKPSSPASVKPPRLLFLSSRDPGSRTQWDEGKVLRRVYQRQSGGLSLESADVRREEPKLYEAARKYFGSWKAVLAAVKETKSTGAAAFKEIGTLDAKTAKALFEELGPPAVVVKNPVKTAKSTVSKRVAPQGIRLRPYLTFNGNCEAAFKFYQKVFGGEFCPLLRFKDKPPPDGNLDAKLRNKIKHVCLVAGSMMLIGADAWPNEQLTVGDNVSLSLETPSAAEAKRIFKALSSNGTVHTPLAPTSWAELFGVATDRFGICWSVNYVHIPF